MKKWITRITSVALALAMCAPLTMGISRAADTTDSLWEQFNTPSAQTKPRPLWFWNSELRDMTPEKVREIVRESYTQSGYNGFGILPNWIQDYLSEDYFELYEAALDEGSKLGMQFSLYDENGFPSYNAGGLLGKLYPDLTTKRLDKVEKTTTKANERVILRIPQGAFLGAVAMNSKTKQRIDISDKAVIRETGFDPSAEPLGTSASSYYTMSEGYTPEKATDGDISTRWNAESMSGGGQYLQINFGEEKTFDTVKIYEDSNPVLHRVNAYTVDYWDSAASEWKTAANGSSITDRGAVHTFAPVTSQVVRLNLSGVSNDSASINEFQILNGAQQLPVPPASAPDDSEIPASGSYLEYTAPEADWQIMAFVCVKEGNDGMDYLDPKSVRAFIDITYEAYYSHFKKYFDNGTITTAFYDEPTFWPWSGTTAYGTRGARLWTPEYNKYYADRFDGESPVLNYPALWYDIGEETDEARDKLQQVRTELFADNYIGQINEWCSDHGIALMGHMLLEEWVNPVGLHGDLMRVFKNQEIPGVDVIGGFGYTQEAYKIISSSAYNWDKKLVMSESFGAMGENMDPNVLYKSSMDQYAKGVNMIIPHAVWYDDNPAAVNFPPELSYRNPKYKDILPVFNSYLGRLNTMLQGGRHIADIAMLYPIDYLESSFIFNNDPNNPGDADYMRIGEALSLKARRDFTYLHPEVINEKCTVEDGTLKLNNTGNFEQYKVFVIPGTQVISLENLKKIKQFYDGGGKVIATTRLPDRATRAQDTPQVRELIKEIFGTNSSAADAKNENANGGKAQFIKSTPENRIKTVLDEMLSVYDVNFGSVKTVSGGNLSYIHKIKDDRNIYFIANSSNSKVNTELTLRGELKDPMQWDPNTGEKMPIPFWYDTVDGQPVTKIQLSMSKIQSLFIVDNNTEKQTPTPPAKTDLTALNTAIAIAEALDSKLYTAESFKAVTDALTVAKAINDKSTQTEADKATSDLNAAIDALKKIEVKPDPKPEPKPIVKPARVKVPAKVKKFTAKKKGRKITLTIKKSASKNKTYIEYRKGNKGKFKKLTITAKTKFTKKFKKGKYQFRAYSYIKVGKKAYKSKKYRTVKVTVK